MILIQCYYLVSNLRSVFLLAKWRKNTVLSRALLLVFRGLKCYISVTQSPKCIQLKRITNQLSLVYTVVKSLYTVVILIYCQLEIIFTLLYIKSMPVVTHNTIHVKDWLKDTFTANSLLLLLGC